MHAQIRARLLADAALAAICGARIEWGLRVPGLPGVRMFTVSSTETYHAEGTAKLTFERVQIDAFAATYGAAKAAADAIKASLSGFAGTLGSARIQRVELINARDTSEAGNTEAETIFGRSLDFLIIHKES